MIVLSGQPTNERRRKMHKLAELHMNGNFSGIDECVQTAHQHSVKNTDKKRFQKKHEGELLFLTIIAIIVLGLFISGSASITAMVIQSNQKNLEICHLNIENMKQLVEKEYHAECYSTTIPD